MKISTTLCFVLCTSFIFSQVTMDSLDHNSVKALVSDGGFFFTDTDKNIAGYEIPKGSGKNIIYSATMWFAGKDVNGNLKMAAPGLYGGQRDLWPGTLTNDGSAVANPQNSLNGTIWSVKKTEILNHMANHQDPNYQTPSSILNWPAHGDVSANEDYFLAPFIDADLDGVYMPENGDYPCIKGDHAVYTIVNDKKYTHDSGSNPIGLEIHYMFYQYENNSALDSTTFIDARIINRSSQSLSDFYSSFVIDGDLGYPSDDYAGVNEERNALFQYNSDYYDEDTSINGVLGYGEYPPSFSVVSLSKELYSAGIYNNAASYPNTFPSLPTNIYNAMKGNDNAGSPWLDNNAQPTLFMYSDLPDYGTGYSELGMGSAPEDKRSLMTLHEPVFPALSELNYSFAVVFNSKGATNVSSVNHLMLTVEEIQSEYDQQVNCPTISLGVLDVETNTVRLFPNPAFNKVNVESNVIIESLEITDLSGRSVHKESKLNQNSLLIDLDWPSGVYFVTINTEYGLQHKQLVID